MEIIKPINPNYLKIIIKPFSILFNNVVFNKNCFFFNDLENIKNQFINNKVETIDLIYKNDIEVYGGVLPLIELNLIQKLFDNLPISLHRLNIIITTNINENKYSSYGRNPKFKKDAEELKEEITKDINKNLFKIKIPFGVEINVEII